jgi:hypothetical protein
MAFFLAQAYEARFNPFAEFQANEEAARVKALPAHDRALLSTSRCALTVRPVGCVCHLFTMHDRALLSTSRCALTVRPDECLCLLFTTHAAPQSLGRQLSPYGWLHHLELPRLPHYTLWHAAELGAGLKTRE